MEVLKARFFSADETKERARKLRGRRYNCFKQAKAGLRNGDTRQETVEKNEDKRPLAPG